LIEKEYNHGYDTGHRDGFESVFGVSNYNGRLDKMSFIYGYNAALSGEKLAIPNDGCIITIYVV